MKRSKLGAAEQGRRARLQTSTAEDSDLVDPIAAAAQAKKAREEARIKAAAEAAAKAFAGRAKTVFYDNKGAGAESPAQAMPDKARSASNQNESTANPLAAILGYEQDDSASEDGSEPPSPRHLAGPAPHTPGVNGNSEADKSGDEDDPMLASFMSELESSGLLDKEPEHAGPPNDPSRAPTQDPTPRTSILSDTHTPDGSASPSTGVDPAGQEAAESNLAATIVNAVTDDQAEVPKQGDAPEQHAADASGAVAASSEAAEQRVLGDLEGAPTWREVMDMASGKVYFWDSATDEVAWEAPPGTQPRSKHDNAATFAAHVSPADTPTAGTTGAAGTTGVALGSADHADGPYATGSSGVQVPGAADTAAAAAATDDKQVASTSGGPPAQTGPPSGEEDGEDGQLAEVRSASPSSAAEQPPQPTKVPPPDPKLGFLGQQVVDQIRQSTHRLCRNIPQLVRLAVEAEVRLQDWQMFSTKQQQAVDLSQAQAAVSWTDVQDHLHWRWQSITAALPAAQEEARQLHTRMDQELEAGEMPPLPSDDAAAASATAAIAQLPSDHTEAPARVPDPVEITLLDPASAAAVSEDTQGMPASGGGGEAAHPSGAPPLPAEDPPSGPTAAPVVGALSSTSAAAAAVDDDDADMDLDMDVDAGTDESQPASAEWRGEGAAAASGAALPDWAGYYMAHGYTYPYYGEAASAPASTSQTAADTSVQPSSSALSTSHPATDLLASRLATPPPPAAQGASPAPQLPFPLKKKQYRAEPAPSFPSPTDGERDAPAEDAAVGGHPSSMAEKQAQEADAKKRKRPKAPVGLGQLAAKKKKGTKGISSMIDKWQAVRKVEEDEQAKAEEELDPAVQERRRLEQAEQWRLQQLKAGASSEENANFQPLSVDWREKLKANRKVTSKSAPRPTSPDSASPSPATASAQADVTADVSMAADGKPNLELLSKGLPAGWRAMWDKNSGDIYYGNLKTRLKCEKDTCQADMEQGCFHSFVSSEQLIG